MILGGPDLIRPLEKKTSHLSALTLLRVSEESASHHELYSRKKINSATNCVSRAEGPQASDWTPALADALIDASDSEENPTEQQTLSHRDCDMIFCLC